jgi:uncharacterized protein (DUF58 family)
MMKDVAFYLAGFILFLFFPISGLYADEMDTLKSGFSIRLTTDRTVYASGDAIEMILEVSNRTNKEITLNFRDAQRFDFVIRKNGETLWLWSEGKMFAQVLGEKRLGPNESVAYTARFAEKLAPGTYTVEAMIVSTQSPLIAGSTIFVE